jgi:hypothetical protein
MLNFFLHYVYIHKHVYKHVLDFVLLKCDNFSEFLDIDFVKSMDVQEVLASIDQVSGLLKNV